MKSCGISLGIALLVLALAVGGLLILVRSGSSERVAQSPNAAQSAIGAQPLPGVLEFMETHRRFGSIRSVHGLPDWSDGRRQEVRTATGRHLVLYLRDGSVVAAWEHGREGRRLAWGETNDSPRGLIEDVSRPSTATLPTYIVLFRNERLSGDGAFGDVLVESMSRDTPAAERERVLRAIAKAERIDDVSLYSTRSAYKANVSASFHAENPNALRTGLLGRLSDGKFTPGEGMYTH